MDIKQLAKYDFSERDTTNHAVLVLVQAFFITDIRCIDTKYSEESVSSRAVNLAKLIILLRRKRVGKHGF